ncbi:uncharacterized protein LOC111717545 isoform X3 [Eurytemora carolleeae]|uniref:uncharacterized protein LOC111717545 isoform X3 n=1 Tax=Eurytemora carolleeae TaxID=1294199 RepID=UPI000C75B255|nr:uncharacterized protein LOC111717545 isoform X3 [Eurytemora carolleeae]|eukprot:XP_023348808.1 uncharacterized protein LOC111717545 isoform X3 [Eurytemora affinis]
MENMGEAEGTSTYRLGGGEKGEWTPAEAADWFAKQYLPDLSEVSVRFPEEWLYSGCSIQTPDLPPDQLAKQMYETVEVEEKDKVGSFMGNVTGDNAEHEMYKYLTGIPKTSRTALFVNYNVSMFQRFRGKPHQNQEFDIVLVFGELRKWLTIEVKAGQKGGKGWADQLKEGKIFYNEVLAATGIDTKDWEYIPVAAFPNAQNRKQVNGVPNFLKQNTNGLVITKHEMSRSLEDLLPKGPKYEIDETYLTLVKWLMASAHCSKLGASLSLTPSDPVKETKRKLVGSNTSDLGVGVSEDPGPSSSTVSQYSSLKGKPVGSQESILFWNKDQAQFLFQDNPRCIIKGDYGSGKTLVLFAKLKSLVEKGRKVVFISCLLPYEAVPPIYEVIMRKKLEEFGDNIRFYSAMDICSEMGVILGKTEREKSFYSVLAKFIQNLPEEFNTLLIDEFGDYLSLDKLSKYQNSRYDEEMLKVSGSRAAGIEGKKLIISLHPRCKIDESKLKDQGYKITKLKYVTRNTASIWKYDKTLSSSWTYYKTLSSSESDSWTSTVLGLQPDYITGSLDKDFYSRIVVEVCKKSRKFVCLIQYGLRYDDNQFKAELVRYDNNQFKAELVRRGIETFEYL